MSNSSLSKLKKVALDIGEDDIKNLKEIKKLESEGVDVSKYLEEGGVLHQKMHYEIWEGITVEVIAIVPLKFVTSESSSLTFCFSEQDEQTRGVCTLSELEGIIQSLNNFKKDAPILQKSYEAMQKGNLGVSYQSLDYKSGGILVKCGQAEKKGVFSSKCISGFEIIFANGGVFIHRELQHDSIFELNTVFKEALKLQKAMIGLVKSM